MNSKSKSQQNRSRHVALCLTILLLLANQFNFAQVPGESEIATAETMVELKSADTVVAKSVKKMDPEKPKMVLLDTKSSDGKIDLALFKVPEHFQSIQILDLNKKVIETIKIPTDRNAFLKLDLSMFKKGTYYLSISNNEEVFARNKFELRD